MQTLPQPLQVDNIADIWAILTAVGTFGAAVGAVGVLLVGYRTYRRQVDDAHAVHAAKVTLYVDNGRVHVENLGDLPVYSVQIAVRYPQVPVPQVSDARPRLAKSEVESMSILGGARLPGHEVWVAFTDSNGVRWVRHESGTLRYKRRNTRPTGV